MMSELDVVSTAMFLCTNTHSDSATLKDASNLEWHWDEPINPNKYVQIEDLAIFMKPSFQSSTLDLGILACDHFTPGRHCRTAVSKARGVLFWMNTTLSPHALLYTPVSSAFEVLFIQVNRSLCQIATIQSRKKLWFLPYHPHYSAFVSVLVNMFLN